MRKLFSRRKVLAGLPLSPGEFIFPRLSELNSPYPAGIVVKFSEEMIASKTEMRNPLIEKLEPTSSSASIFTSKNFDAVKKCRGCGSMEISGNRCNYCRGLV